MVGGAPLLSRISRMRASPRKWGATASMVPNESYESQARQCQDGPKRTSAQRPGPYLDQSKTRYNGNRPVVRGGRGVSQLLLHEAHGLHFVVEVGNSALSAVAGGPRPL